MKTLAATGATILVFKITSMTTFRNTETKAITSTIRYSTEHYIESHLDDVARIRTLNIQGDAAYRVKTYLNPDISLSLATDNDLKFVYEEDEVFHSFSPEDKDNYIRFLRLNEKFKSHPITPEILLYFEEFKHVYSSEESQIRNIFAENVYSSNVYDSLTKKKLEFFDNQRAWERFVTPKIAKKIEYSLPEYKSPIQHLKTNKEFEADKKADFGKESLGELRDTILEELIKCYSKPKKDISFQEPPIEEIDSLQSHNYYFESIK